MCTCSYENIYTKLSADVPPKIQKLNAPIRNCNEIIVVPPIIKQAMFPLKEKPRDKR